MPFFYFFLFQAVDCLLNRTRVSDVVEKGTGAPTVEDTGADTNLGPASERKPKALLSPPPGASKASQSNHVDIIDNEETPGLLPDNCSSYFLPGGSVLYPVEGEVKCSFAGRQGSICRVAICPRLRPDIPFFFVSAAWSIFWIFSFFFFVTFC